MTVVFLGILVALTVVAVVAYVRHKGKIRQEALEEIDADKPVSYIDMARRHLKQARYAEKTGNWFDARDSYKRCIESLKNTDDMEAMKAMEAEYADFAKRDPVFNTVLPFLLNAVRQNPGIVQSELSDKAASMHWEELRSFNNGHLSKEDIRYILYFAAEQGHLIRQKKGRSYQLFLPKHQNHSEQTNEKPIKNVDEIFGSRPSLQAVMQKESYERIMQAEMHPYIMYRTGNHQKCRAEHTEWDGLVLPKYDRWWESHLPHNDPECNCHLLAVTEARLERYKSEGVPVAPRLDGTGGGYIPVKMAIP